MGVFWDWFMEGTGRSGSPQWPDVNENKGKEINVIEYLLGWKADRKSQDYEGVEEWGSQFQRGNFSGPTAGYWDDNGMWHDDWR